MSRSCLGLLFGDGSPILDASPASPRIGNCTRHGNAVFEYSINGKVEGSLVIGEERRAADRWNANAFG